MKLLISIALVLCGIVIGCAVSTDSDMAKAVPPQPHANIVRVDLAYEPPSGWGTRAIKGTITLPPELIVVLVDTRAEKGTE